MYNLPYGEMYDKTLKAFENTDAKNPINHILIKNTLRKRDKSIHKGSCGSLTVCAGSTGLTGAACLSCEAALKSGCGLVTLCCANDLNTIFETKLTEVMTFPVSSKNGVIKSSAFKKILKKANTSDAMLFGPGLSKNKSIKKLLGKFLKKYSKPIVIDADGLNVLSENTDVLKNHVSDVILTPHIGEFSRLTGFDKEYILNNTEKLALEFAQKYDVILVLKSHKTVVSDGKMVYSNILGNPGMAVGGSGDVLAGLIASFISQGNSALQSALAGVYIHSLAGDMALLETGEYALTPSDIIKYIHHATRETTLRA